ncbi:MAG TPA: Gfo/Idh/MocA family oxidoreductase [Acidimicrobiia bacterium]|nr:Gfo/Idh/MocA family oxidoreductase [Acidimicrobiia bacterium]
MADTPRLAIVGLGWWGTELVKAVKASGAAAVTTCFARTEESRREFAAEHGISAADSFQAILADPEVDGVLLATSHSSHVPLLIEAASAGKHVFVEKPLTLTVAEGRRGLAAADRAGVVLQVGHNRRRQPANRKIKEMIDSGELGQVVAVEALHTGGRGLHIDPQSWRADPAESPLSGMTGMGVHQIDNMHYLIGPIKAVSARSNRLVKRTSLDDASVLVLEFASGVVGTLVTSYVAPPMVRSSVIGTKAAAWNELDGKRLLIQSASEREPRATDMAFHDTLADELAEFARCITTGATPETGGIEGLRVVAVMEAAMKAAATGGLVEVEDVG